MATDNPTARIGDISGEISIAPIIIAAELVSKPIEASIEEQSSIHKLYPLNETPSLIVAFVFSKSAFSLRFNMLNRYFLIIVAAIKMHYAAKLLAILPMVKPCTKIENNTIK